MAVKKSIAIIGEGETEWWYSDDNLTPFFERIKAHNKYFDACPYRMLGFAENKDGNVCAVLVQPFIAEARLATEQEIRDEFLRLGFQKIRGTDPMITHILT